MTNRLRSRYTLLAALAMGALACAHHQSSEPPEQLRPVVVYPKQYVTTISSPIDPLELADDRGFEFVSDGALVAGAPASECLLVVSSTKMATMTPDGVSLRMSVRPSLVHELRRAVERLAAEHNQRVARGESAESPLLPVLSVVAASNARRGAVLNFRSVDPDDVAALRSAVLTQYLGHDLPPACAHQSAQYARRVD